MTEQQARTLLQRLLTQTQRLRSIAMENGTIDAAALVDRWVYDNEYTIVNGLDRALKKEQIEPIDLYNMMTIVARSRILQATSLDDPFPAPDQAWLLGWEGSDAA